MIKITLGSSKILFQSSLRPDKYCLFLPHGDEHTPWETAKYFSDRYDYLKVISPDRIINFKYRHKNYFIDLNRIFTKKGIKKFLHANGQGYNPVLVEEIYQFGQKLIKIILRNKTVIALHSNTYGGFNVKYFLNNPEAESVYLKRHSFLDDFILVTKSKDFNYLKRKKINSVLQNKIKSQNDDGSLSVYCKIKKIRYFNLEIGSPKYKIVKASVRRQSHFLEAVNQIL